MNSVLVSPLPPSQGNHLVHFGSRNLLISLTSDLPLPLPPLYSCFFDLFFGVYVGSLLLRGEEKGTAPVIKQVSWFQVLVFFYIYAITILPPTNPS